jgi:hypothetical protein
MAYHIPILFTVFNRPEPTEKVFQKIRQQQPLYLYIAADGPRPHAPTDAENCAKTRAIMDTIDWPCTVKTRYLEINLGCGKAMSQAITWFFEQVEYGVILEDDCLPEDSFFPYCEALLHYYKDDPRIGVINGNSFLPESTQIPNSYYFSRFPHIWGWASWRRVWQHYDFTLNDWPKDKKNNWLATIFDTWTTNYYWKHILEAVYTGALDTWDYQLAFTCFKKRFLCIVPEHNLITNIGFGITNATHTQNKHNKWAQMNVRPMAFPLRHPEKVIQNPIYDRYTQKQLFCWWKMAIKKVLPPTVIRWYKKQR